MALRYAAARVKANAVVCGASKHVRNCHYLGDSEGCSMLDRCGAFQAVEDAGNDETVRRLAQFAVDEKIKIQGSLLRLARILRVRLVIVAGVRYDIIFEVLDQAKQKKCLAVVVEQPWLNHTFFSKWMTLDDTPHEAVTSELVMQ